MKKVTLSIVLAAICSLFMGLNANAQKPTLESLLPQSVQNNFVEMKDNHSILMSKVLALNPGLKNKAQLATHFNTAFAQLKLLKPALKNLTVPIVSATAYDDLIATKSQQQGAQSGAVKILKALKDSINGAGNNAVVISSMCSIIKSTTFTSLSATDKDMFYNAFATAKIAFDYSQQNNLLVLNNPHSSKMGVGGIYLDDAEESANGKWLSMGCHWMLTVAGGAAGFVVGGPVGAGAGTAIGFGAGAGACY